MSINRPLRALVVLTVLLLASLMTCAQTNPTESSPDLNRGIELYHQGKYAEASNLLVPATLNGLPVSMFIQLEYNFNLY